MNPVLHAKLARNDSLSAARHFVNCGFRPIPIPGKSKAPDMANWPNFKAELDSLEELFSPQCNVGLLLGERANGLIDVDLDCAEAIALAPHWLLSTGWIHGRQSKPSSHWWYRCKESLRPRKYQDIDGTCLLELRSTGQQTLVPPSMHPSGESLDWEICGTPSEVGNELTESVDWLAACTLVARHWPTEGSRQDLALALAGTLLRSGFREERIELFIKGAAEAGIDADLVASAVITFMEDEESWQGTASELLNDLNEYTSERMTRQRQWPKTPTELGNRLRRVSKLLPQKGVSIDCYRKGKDRTRMIELTSARPRVRPVRHVHHVRHVRSITPMKETTQVADRADAADGTIIGLLRRLLLHRTRP